MKHLPLDRPISTPPLPGPRLDGLNALSYTGPELGGRALLWLRNLAPDPYDPEDLVEDVSVHVIKSAHTFDPERTSFRFLIRDIDTSASSSSVMLSTHCPSDWARHAQCTSDSPPTPRDLPTEVARVRALHGWPHPVRSRSLGA
jgi:hypothetical protein